MMTPARIYAALVLACLLLASCSREKDKPARVITSPDLKNVCMQAANGKYICCQAGLKGMLTANRDIPAAWEQFRMAELGNGFIALMGVNDKYVSVLSDDGGILAAQSSQIGASEIFEVKKLNDSTTALKAYNGYYVCYDSGRYNKMFATAPAMQQHVPVKIIYWTNP